MSVTPAVRRVLFALAAVGVIAFGVSRLATHDTPAGQPPLATLDAASLDGLREAFNAAAGSTRLVVLLSPT